MVEEFKKNEELFFDTILIKENGKPFLWDLHMERNIRSANFFGFLSIPEEFEMRDLIEMSIAKSRWHGPWRVRLSFFKDSFSKGVCKVSAEKFLSDYICPFDPWQVLVIERGGTNIDSYPLQKTLLNKFIRRAQRYSEERGCEDALLIDGDEHVLEFSRGNIFVLKDGVWYTPAISNGLLPGVMRRAILESKHFETCEEDINVEKLIMSQAVIFTNALRLVVGIESIVFKGRKFKFEASKTVKDFQNKCLEIFF